MCDMCVCVVVVVVVVVCVFVCVIGLGMCRDDTLRKIREACGSFPSLETVLVDRFAGRHLGGCQSMCASSTAVSHSSILYDQVDW